MSRNDYPNPPPWAARNSENMNAWLESKGYMGSSKETDEKPTPITSPADEMETFLIWFLGITMLLVVGYPIVWVIVMLFTA